MSETKEPSTPCIGTNTQPWCEEVGIRSTLGECEGEGWLPGRRGLAHPRIHRGGHMLISLRAFDRGPRGHPRLVVTPPLSLHPFVVMQTDLITRLTKGGVGLGHRGQCDVPHKDGRMEQDPYGSAGARMARVRHDIGRGWPRRKTVGREESLGLYRSY